MAVRELDSRAGEADRALTEWSRRNVPPDVIRAVLPLLVGPLRAQRVAERFLSQATVGLDLTEEGAAERQRLLAQARALVQSAKEQGLFVGTKMYRPDPAPTERDINRAFDRNQSAKGYPGADINRGRIARADAEAAMKAKHGRTAEIDDNGDVTVKDERGRRHKVNHVAIPKSAPRSELRSPRAQRRVSLSRTVVNYRTGEEVEVDV